MPPMLLPGILPQVGELVTVRSRRWLVEEVLRSAGPREIARGKSCCADDDAGFEFKGNGSCRSRRRDIESSEDNSFLEKQGGRE